MVPALDGYTVIDLSVGIAGAYCTKLLADGGATVIKVEPPEGDSLRGWSASRAEITVGDDGALFSFLACSKHSVVVDPEDSDGVRMVGAFPDLLGPQHQQEERDAGHPQSTRRRAAS